jgi:hypothetical protein
MKKKADKKKIWMVVLATAALVFLVLGVVKFTESNYLMAGTSLITTLSFSWIVLRIKKGKINFDTANDGLNIFLPVGFAFTIIGGSGFLGLGVWGFGLSLVVVGLLFSPKKNDALKENAG